MKPLAALLLFLIGLAGPIVAQEAAEPAAVVVRQSVDPASGAVVGQHIAVYVDVLFRSEMPHPPRVSLPEVPGAQVIRFETQGTTIRENMAGASYVGQRFEFALYARRGGAFEIPPAAVALLDRQGDETGHTSGQSLKFDVGVPPGVDPSKPVVATHRLSLEQQWQPSPVGPFKPGDAVVRTLTRSAEDIPGLAMLDLAFTAPDGVRVYADSPDIRDSVSRGVVTGHRVDRATYVFERGGDFRLPALAQTWWDLGAHAAKTAEAAAATVHVEPVAAPSGAGTTQRENFRLLAWSAIALIISILIALIAYALLRHRRAWRADPERAAFDALRRACASGPADEIYRRFCSWRIQLPVAAHGAADIETTELRAALFNGGTQVWTRSDANLLADHLSALRPRNRSAKLTARLPPLNPLSRE